MNSIMSIPSRIPRELNQGGVGTTELVFTSDGTLPVILPLPSDGKLAAIGSNVWAATAAGGPRACSMFKVAACGRVTTPSAINVTVKIYFGTSATVGSNTAIATTGVVSVNGASNWMIEVSLVWDSDSNKINGHYKAQLGTTTVAETTITNAITSGADPDGGSTLGFVVTGTFGTGSASNKLYLDWFWMML